MRGAIATAATLSVLLLGAQVARADQVTTTVEQTSVTSPTIMPIQPVVPDATRRTVIMGTTGPSDTTTSELFAIKEFGGNENYAKRLSAMADQIQLGLSRGYINQDQANQLMEKQAQLVAFEQNVASKGFVKPDSDVLEKQMNVFQIEIHRVLTDGAKTAGVGIIE